MSEIVPILQSLPQYGFAVFVLWYLGRKLDDIQKVLSDLCMKIS